MHDDRLIGETRGFAMTTNWSADQYLKFESERNRPIADLLGAIPARYVRSAVDLGCGPGNSTELLAARFPAATIIGVDSAANMIAAARKRLPHLVFEQIGIAQWLAGAHFVTGGSTTDAQSHGDARLDLILANAVLQWLPDHARLLPALVAKLAPGGSLAVQIPDNLAEPVQQLMREVAADGPWRERLARAGGERTPIAAPDWYHALLRPACSRLDVWRTTYYHPLAGIQGVIEWFSGSGLRPFLARLEADEQSEFLARYANALERTYPLLQDGSILLPMPRLFIVATR